ncbi:hypothetical protein GCM10012287_02920 [Streptomyces daqingensis]|uniref:Uncharacterized protein n=1 Tax=Streptomyces daqingensis TaxID=1472640 RepID=A0ABQ2LRT1_9ACTN|nr:hypothetical protein GCM10012287_02920 [Streptomyces daqingensis]
MSGYESTCLAPQCGSRLAGRQRRFCSELCSTRYRRSLTREPLAARSCALCGDLFDPKRRTQTICTYDEADLPCQELQNDLEDMRVGARFVADKQRAEQVCENPSCGKPIPYSGRGRPSKFCAPRCRTAAYRAAKAA